MSRLRFHGSSSPFLQGGSLGFVPNLCTSSKVSLKGRALVARFGDGYSQVMPDGINPDAVVIRASFEKYTQEEMQHIVDFFRGKQPLYDRNIYEPFLFTPPAPFGKEILVRVTPFDAPLIDVSWDQGNISSVTVELTEIFNP